MRNIATAGRLALVLVLVASSGAAGERFFHLRVVSDDGERVTINLPMRLVERGVAMAPRDLRWHGHVDLDCGRLDWEDLRALRDASRRLGPGQSVEVRLGRRRTEVSRQGSTVRIEAPARHWYEEDVEASVPFEVLDALVGGRRNELDLAAGLRALERHDAGWTLHVEDESGTTRARMWVDDVTEAG